MLEQMKPVDRVFYALGDPARRLMIDRLSRGPQSVSKLADPLDMTLAAVVQHVQVLEQCGVIKTEKVGRVRTCRLDPLGLSAAERWIATRRALWQRRFDRLGELLEAQDATANENSEKKGRRKP